MAEESRDSPIGRCGLCATENLWRAGGCGGRCALDENRSEGNGCSFLGSSMVKVELGLDVGDNEASPPKGLDVVDEMSSKPCRSRRGPLKGLSLGEL